MTRSLMNIRTFLRGGLRTLTEPTEIIVGAEIIGTWTPAGWVEHGGVGYNVRVANEAERNDERNDEPAATVRVRLPKVPQAITSAPSAGHRFGVSRPAPKR